MVRGLAARIEESAQVFAALYSSFFILYSLFSILCSRFLENNSWGEARESELRLILSRFFGGGGYTVSQIEHDCDIQFRVVLLDIGRTIFLAKSLGN